MVLLSVENSKDNSASSRREKCQLPVRKMTSKLAHLRVPLSFSLPRAPSVKQQVCSPSACRISEEMTVSYNAARRSFAAAIICAASFSWLSFPSSIRAQDGSSTPAGKHFDQVVIVILENEGTDQALADPYISSLTRGKAAWFSRYYAITHPSFPNYLAIVAGSTFGIDSDHRPAPLNGATIADRLEEKNLTWKSYAENYPGGCYLGSAAGEGRLAPNGPYGALCQEARPLSRVRFHPEQSCTVRARRRCQPVHARCAGGPATQLFVLHAQHVQRWSRHIARDFIQLASGIHSIPARHRRDAPANTGGDHVGRRG